MPDYPENGEIPLEPLAVADIEDCLMVLVSISATQAARFFAADKILASYLLLTKPKETEDAAAV